MRSVLVVAVLATTAHAQAPGQVAPQPPGVMLDRWAIDVALGDESATPKVDGATRTGFGLLELSGRFRIRADIEVALTLGGSSHDNVSTGGLYADFRYRFLAARPWTVIALAGIGAESIGDKDGTDAEKKARGSLRLGAGVERRFGHFALEADLRLFAIAENKDVVMTSQVIDNAYELARYGVSGASLTLGATNYF